MLRQRLILGPVMVGLFLLIVYADQRLGVVYLRGSGFERLVPGLDRLPPGVVLFAIIAVLIGLVACELCTMVRAKGLPADRVTVVFSALAGLVVVYLLPGSLDGSTVVAVLSTVATLVVLLAVVRHGWGGRTDGALVSAGLSAFSLVYLGVMPGFLLMIRKTHSAPVVAAVVLLPKVCDIGAYFVGRAIGRHKLIPWLSPGKTWEGLLGGVMLSGGLCAGLVWLGTQCQVLPEVENRWFYGVPLWSAGLAGAFLGALGQGGDLLASLLKRDAGIKDSGQTVPGFGGLLDVIDSPILVAPAAYWLLLWASGS